MNSKSKFNLGGLLIVIGFILTFVKAVGLGLATVPWWLVTMPIYLPFVLFILFMIIFGSIVGTRYGIDKIAKQAFEEDEKQCNTCQGCCSKKDKN